MFSLPVARVTSRQLALLAIAGLLALAFLVASSPTVAASTSNPCKWTYLRYAGSGSGGCGGWPCSDFEIQSETCHYRISSVTHQVCSKVCAYGCRGDRWCGGIVSDPGEVPLGEPGQAAAIACALDSLPSTVDNGVVSADSTPGLQSLDNPAQAQALPSASIRTL